MFSKIEKKRIDSVLKAHGIRRKGDVVDLINRGATPSEIDVFIQQLIDEVAANKKPVLELLEVAQEHKIFGQHLIAQNALDDMSAIMRLPYVMSGALMPDGHRVEENHVPVGGVVLSDAIVPGIVGSDIACSVLLTVLDQPIDNEWLEQAIPSIKYTLKNYAYFGQETNPEPAVFDQPFYRQSMSMETDLGKQVFDSVKKIARNHFGTSGDGNHFVEVGTVNIQRNGASFHNTGKKRYLGLLSHFGSRAVGSTIAKVFCSEVAALFDMPKGMPDAPLDPDSPLGRDYWKLMEWAGEFAEAGHRWLHNYLLGHLGDRVTLSYSKAHSIYSKHNFAWATSEGYLHRKGATPADFGQFGVIPATMGDATQVVVGLGNPDSMSSASHGAGRRFSRGSAIQQFGKSDTAEHLLKEYGVHLLGGGPDEDPRAYKKIGEVMSAQEECVTTVGGFEPIVVRMANPRFLWR
jgi:tRNA-splicing ligase RtcB (3'-phosphate/5'-hydroxy nucleic acid ligase)